VAARAARTLTRGLAHTAHAEQFYLGFVTSSDAAREQMRQVFAETDTRLPPLERARKAIEAALRAEPERERDSGAAGQL
jgi:hypothetical protein